MGRDVIIFAPILILGRRKSNQTGEKVPLERRNEND
jgi:hypothetical protein